MRRSSWFGMSAPGFEPNKSSMGKDAPLMEYDFRRRCEAALEILRLWRRFRSAPSSARRRSRLGLLVAIIAALALMGNGFAAVKGVDMLVLTDDGAVIAAVSAGDRLGSATVRETHVSRDGGMSWSQYDGLMPDLRMSQSVFTPRGVYVTDGLGVARISGYGHRELAYSTEHLRGDANQWLQERDTRNMRYRALAKHPRNIVYHADSGNVIAAMGIQGVAVETPDGRWHKIAVGPYAPTDFSFSAKTRALMESAGLVGGIALALALSALAVSAAASEYDKRGLVGALLLIAALGSLGLAGLITDYPLLIVAASAPVSLAATIAAVVFAAAKPDGGARWKFASLACVSTLPPSIMLLLTTGLSNNVCNICLDADFYRLAFSVAAAISLIPPLAYHARFIARHWRPFAMAFLGMNALAALIFALWVYLNVSLEAAQTAVVVLVGLAAVVLVWRVRDERRASGESGRGRF